MTKIIDGKEIAQNLRNSLKKEISELKVKYSSVPGLAVVQVERGACGGCFSSITAQHSLNIRLRKDILFCENCGRILAPDDIDG